MNSAKIFHKRNFGLDLVRAISIWLVLLQHAGINIPYLGPLKIGTIGVEVFFVLSGFLIGGILFKEFEKGFGIGKTLKNFWLRRWFRILPLYYAVLIIKFIFIDDSIGWNLIYYLLFLQSNFYGIDYLVVSWSLVIEEWFYIFAPIFLFFSYRWLASNKKITISIVLFILAVICFRSLNVYYRDLPYEGINGNFIFRFDSLFVGVLISWLKHSSSKLYRTLSSPFCFTAGAVLFISYLYYYWNLCYPVNLINESLIPRTLGFFILPFTIGMMIPFSAQLKNGLRQNWLLRSWSFAITWTSVLTYGIYLLHPFIYSRLLHGATTDYFMGRWVASIMVIYLIAGLVYRYFELPILKYRDFVTRKTKSKKSIPPI